MLRCEVRQGVRRSASQRRGDETWRDGTVTSECPEPDRLCKRRAAQESALIMVMFPLLEGIFIV